jgi:hypothetical protein
VVAQFLSICAYFSSHPGTLSAFEGNNLVTFKGNKQIFGTPSTVP